MEPDCGGARHLERSQHVAGCSRILVRGGIAHLLEVVEQVSDLARHDRAELQRTERVVEVRLCGRKQRMAGSYFLGQEFGELAQLDQRSGSIVIEIALGKRSQPRELHVMRRQEVEVRTDRHIGQVLAAITQTSSCTGRNIAAINYGGGSQ